MLIEQVHRITDKSHVVSTILNDLPEWFGIEESTQQYIEDANNLPVYVLNNDEKAIGFLCLKETSVDTVEIYCMAIKKDFHHQGLGTKLYSHVEHIIKKQYKYVQVKTVDEGNYEQYDRTILFYKSLGFSKLEVFDTLWDPHNPCLILIKKL